MIAAVLYCTVLCAYGASRCLARGARAVLQVYPENAAQAEMIVAAAMKVCTLHAMLLSVHTVLSP